MTIQYALTRAEIAGGFFRGLRASTRFLVTNCIYAVVLSGVILSYSGVFSRPLTYKAGSAALVLILGYFAFMPAFLFLRGKTTLRTLTISQEGIHTEIGKMKADRPWSSIKVVSESNSFVVLAGASGNAFFIPDRAFSGLEQKAEFLAMVRGWKS